LVECFDIRNDAAARNGSASHTSVHILRSIFSDLSGRVSCGWLKFAGLENDGVEQEQTYILHTKKNFNVYNM